MTDQAETLAQAFADGLRSYLTPDQWAEMQRRNATPEYGGPVCASHDFCDANMFMIDAFKAIMGREPMGSYETHLDAATGQIEADDPAEEAAALADNALWNAAWTIAGRLYLITPGAVQHATNPKIETLRAKIAAMRIARTA